MKAVLLASLALAAAFGQSSIEATVNELFRLKTIEETVVSPDSKQIAVLFSKDAPRFGGAIEAIEPELGVIDSQVFDQKLAIVDVASGALREITGTGISVHEFDWSPDSKQIVYTAAASPAD